MEVVVVEVVVVVGGVVVVEVVEEEKDEVVGPASAELFSSEGLVPLKTGKSKAAFVVLVDGDGFLADGDGRETTGNAGDQVDGREGEKLLKSGRITSDLLKSLPEDATGCPRTSLGTSFGTSLGISLGISLGNSLGSMIPSASMFRHS